jgi:hypothetical protein
MAQFDKLERSELTRIEYHITDDHGRTAQLTAEQARDLLQWLYTELEEAEETTTRLPTLPKSAIPSQQAQFP